MEGNVNGESKFFKKKVNFVTLEVEGPQSDPFSDCEPDEFTFDPVLTLDSSSESDNLDLDLALSRGLLKGAFGASSNGDTVRGSSGWFTAALSNNLIQW